MRGTLAIGVAFAALAGAAASAATQASTASCPLRYASASYATSVRAAVASNRDLWGGELLRERGGPTYEGARRYLAPLTQGVQWGARPLTQSGSYYLPLSFPFTPYGSTVFALHVADGSQIVTRHVGGPSLAIYVGDGTELYGACEARRPPPQLQAGYLPVLQTKYTDASGVRYRQESFVGRQYGAYGVRSVISFIRLSVDARKSKRGATIRLAPWRRLAHTAADRFALGGQTRLIVSDGADFVQGVARYRVPAGKTMTIYADWLNAPSDARYLHADAKTFAVARSTVVSFWQQRLFTGATYDVPETTVQNAKLGILEQLISYSWRYSVGNPYEELSYAESLDAAEVAVEYGYPDVSRQIIEFALARMRARPWRFTAFRGSHILSTAATYYRLTRDHDFLKRNTPQLDALVARIKHRQRPDGRLEPEPLSTDLEDHYADSAPGQITAVQALLSISRAWQSAGYTAEAGRARTLAHEIDHALRPAVSRASTWLRDKSLFVPANLASKKPFGTLTATRDGSYWNLVMPYAFASGWFEPHSRASRGILRYLLGHGSRMLGVPRTYAHTVYGAATGAGLAQVYGLSASRFFADNDQPDQLVLSLYGMLAAGMTTGTFVSGEAVSVLPVRGAYDRTMFMPPNSGANASYLETLRLLLVHERRGQDPGLDLAFATPRAWLANGQEIDVKDAPTSWGKVSFSLVRNGASITGTLKLPARSHARLRLRVPAGERVTRVVVGSKAVPVGAGGTVDLDGLSGSLALRATVQ